MTIAFELQGEQFVALNGGPGFPFTNAVSLVVNCESQAEIDHYWEKRRYSNSPSGSPFTEACLSREARAARGLPRVACVR
jgi:predicted 3-demethylubiquinone-9 3-methyltransferase (glyoxalase superfamily)